MALTRIEMAAIIDAGKPLVFNGVLYTNSDDLPTQLEIDELYAGAGQGIQGVQGKSAYDVAVENGFVGTEEEWLESLTGATGAGGIVNTVNGIEAEDVVLNADDIDDSTTTKKFTTQAEKDAWDAKADLGDIPAPVDISGKADITYVDSEVSTLETSIASKADADALNASNLTSGTIPDARFPATLPAVSGANLTNLPAGGSVIDQQAFTANGTWTKPSGVKTVIVQVWGAGGGASGGTYSCGGGGGAYNEITLPASLLPSTVAVTVGTGGAGAGAAQAGNGDSSSFGAYCFAGGGGGANSSTGAGAGGGNASSATGAGNAAGAGMITGNGGATPAIPYMSGGVWASTAGKGNANWGGASGGTNNPDVGRSSLRGGGGGGGKAASDTQAGGTMGTLTEGGGAAANGGTPTFGQGAGATTSATGTTGGVAGGGGAAATTGGAGGRGEVRVISF